MKFIVNYSDAIIHNRFFSDQNEKSSEGSIATAECAPVVNIDKFVIIADIRGVKPENIKVSMEAGILIVKEKMNPKPKRINVSSEG